MISAGATNTEVTDPVCGMKVNPHDSFGPIPFDGADYYFCSEKCEKSFGVTPQKYLKHDSKAQNNEGAASPSASSGVTYTCPMHSEIKQKGPGACPICGMALEPLYPSARGATPESHEL